MKRIVFLSAIVAILTCPAFAQTKRAHAVALSAEQVVSLANVTGDDGRDLTIQLFPDLTVTAVMKSPAIQESDRVVVTGVVKGVPDSSVTLSTRDNALFGVIRTGGKAYEIHGNGANTVAYEVDLNAFPPETEPQDEMAGGPVAASAMVVPAATTDPIIDVLVLYTTKAKNEIGGAASMEAMINAAFAETNMAYENSGVKQRIRLAQAVETTYDEDDLGGQSTDVLFSVALTRLAGTTDGFMDDVHQIRDAKAADLVSLIIHRTTTSCGLGRIGTPPRDTASFSVVDRTCTATNLSFAHELGHNMGLMHDRANTDSTGLTPYAYGYQDPDGDFRTIMAYAAGCPGGCPRVPRFSNPDLTYNGKTTGFPLSDTARATSSAMTLNQSALMVANLRGQTTAPENLAVTEHTTSRDFDTSTEQAVNRTKNFASTDARIYATLRVANFTGLHTVQRRWYSPDGSLYASSATAYTGTGETRTFSGNIAIAGSAAATRLGGWRVEYLLDGALASTDTFSITSNGARPCSIKWRGHC